MAGTTTPDQWSDPKGRNISVNDFNALVAAMGKGNNYVNGYGFELVQTQVQAWAPIEAGSTPGGPGGGFLEGYSSLKFVQQFVQDPTVPIALMCRFVGFGNGSMASFAFASDVAKGFRAAAEVGDLAVGQWFATLATPVFNVVNWLNTVLAWRAENS